MSAREVEKTPAECASTFTTSQLADLIARHVAAARRDMRERCAKAVQQKQQELLHQHAAGPFWDGYMDGLVAAAVAIEAMKDTE